jgi:hypothetical protein
VERVLLFPTGCGPDTLNVADSAINKFAIYGDSCNNKVYFYNPNLKSWAVIGGAASNITGLISAGSNITITGTGTTEDPYVINSSGGGGTTKYVLQGYGTTIDSSGDNYTINVDTTLLKDTSYVGRGIKNDASLHPGHPTLIVDSNYIRDTSLNLAGGTINQVLKKNSSTNGDWSWADESGGTTIDTTSLSNRIDENATNIATNTTAIGTKLSNITGLITAGTNVTVTGSGTSGSPYVINSSGGGSSGTSFVKQEFAGIDSSVIITDTTTWFILNPATIAPSDTLILPASPSDGQTIKISFGGTVTSGTVVTLLVLTPNTGQEVLGDLKFSNLLVTDKISLTYNSSNQKWYE